MSEKIQLVREHLSLYPATLFSLALVLVMFGLGGMVGESTPLVARSAPSGVLPLLSDLVGVGLVGWMLEGKIGHRPVAVLAVASVLLSFVVAYAGAASSCLFAIVFFTARVVAASASDDPKERGVWYGVFAVFVIAAVVAMILM